MRLLLDTHALLWFLADDPRLSRTADAAISDPASEVFVSIASLWEITIKTSLGKLVVDEPFETVMPARLLAERIDVLPITMAHLVALRALPHHRRDPFGRLIIAQATAEALPVVTADAAFPAYGVPLVWGEA